VSVEKNEIIDEHLWFRDNDLQLPAWNGGDAGRPDPGVPPVTGLGPARLVTLDGDVPIGVYPHHLAIFDAHGEPDLLYDLRAFAWAPSAEVGDEAFVEQEATWATVKGGVLYASIGHRTYAKSSHGKNAYLQAFDLPTGRMTWRSAPLVCNMRNFLVRGPVIVCGYGFTAEPDFLHLVDRSTGALLEKEPLKTGPDLVIERDGRLFVRTYDRDYVFEVR
ncbi:MAG: hypothetical protein KC656_17535, partial [Myxococcales bacterium]|nr:hypothetical protein [Myxococcales bacterium]